jgi:hypothetical protein
VACRHGWTGWLTSRSRTGRQATSSFESKVHWPLHHEVSDAVDSLDLPRPMPSSPGAADTRLQGRPEPGGICPLDGAFALAVGPRSETSSGAIRHL